MFRYVKHYDDTVSCNLSTYVCDCFLGAHKINAFQFILKLGCDKLVSKPC
jgi:hypothetical protein